MTTRSGTTRTLPALAYTVSGPASARRTLVLSHALGCDRTLWDALNAHLTAAHCVVRYEHRGHGHSASPPGPYTMNALAQDAARLIDELELAPVTWIGLSLGAMVGQELALRRPELLERLVLANTTSGYDAAARAGWNERIAQVEVRGLAGIADGALVRWFQPRTHREQPETIAAARGCLLGCDARGYAACCAAIRDLDTSSRLPSIRVPTLVIAGALDHATPPSAGELIARRIPGARYVQLPEASHLSVLEAPEAFRAALDAWLPEPSQPSNATP